MVNPMQTVTPEAMQPIDMARERAGCSFDVDGMTCIFAGTRRARDRARWLLGLLKSHPQGIFDKDRRPFQGRTERFFAGQQIALEYFQLRNRYGLPKEDRDLLRLFLDEYITLQVHESMGHPTVETQSSTEQWQEWGQQVASGRFLISYAQTEMAHGSALANLRTTATYCPDTEEWEIHTPEPSAGKLWIGGSGSSATHAIVMANLWTQGKSYGMHPFLVPLRDPDTHRLLPGRTAIDMGPKKGAPSMDNGYLTFNHVRIPRGMLLQRFQTVDAQGRYQVQNQQGKLLIRGTMTTVRTGLCEIAAHHAARATLIAIRYALIRRQGTPLPQSKAAGETSAPSPLERQIIDYPGVQQRLFTAIASSYALTLAARHLRSIYNQLQAELHQKGQSDLLSIVHGYTSILKPVMTNESYQVIWRCRKSMGGLGFSAASGLTDLENSQPDANLTYEGDNNMLLGGPAANFVVKQVTARLRQGRPSRPELGFLTERPEATARFADSGISTTDLADRLHDAQEQLRIVGYRAARLAFALHNLRHGQGNQREEPSVQAYLDAKLAARASRAAGQYFILYAFHANLDTLRRLHQTDQAQQAIGVAIQPAHLTALHNLANLYAWQVCILDEVGEYTEAGYLDTTTIWQLERLVAQAMQRVRPDAFGLVEAADMDDWYLAAPLAPADGRAYDRMIEFMHSEPLNRSDLSNGGREADGVLKGFRQTVGRLTHGEVTPWNQEEARRREQERQQERLAKL